MYQDRILTDLKLLAEKPIFPPSPRETNAERFLTGFIAWNNADPLHSLEHDKLVELQQAHPSLVIDGKGWPGFVADEKVYELSLAWIDQLSAYDSLDLTTHPQFSESLKRIEETHGVARIGLIGDLPFPQYSELRFAAFARAAQLQREGRAEEGLEIFHHIAHLIATSDSLIGSMTSVSMLTSEKWLASNLSVQWTPVDDERIEAMKRTAWAWLGLMRLQAPTGSLGVFEPFMKRDLGACTWVIEAAPSAELVLSDYLQPTLVFEPNLNERLERERSVFTRALGACGHSELGAFYAPITSPTMIGRAIPNPARFPFLRRVLGLSLVSVAQPNTFKMYEDHRRPASQ
jgi:hypothetical protein